ncbi:hypothetical protein V2G26_009824 [Clonostachys chloroleuca]
MIETTTVEGAISAPDTHVRIMMIAEEMATTGRVLRTKIWTVHRLTPHITATIHETEMANALEIAAVTGIGSMIAEAAYNTRTKDLVTEAGPHVDPGMREARDALIASCEGVTTMRRG